MTITQPPKGTHFSDGVRTGPFLGSQFTSGANVLSPSVQVSTPIAQVAPGVFNTPMSLLDIIPAPITTAGLAALQTPAAAGYLNLVTASAQGVTVMTYQSVSGVLQLDSARNVVIVGSGGGAASNFTVFGWDFYGMPTVEQINHPGGAVTVAGKKAFLYIRAIYSSAGTATNVSAGVGNVFGLQHYVSNSNYIGIPEWNAIPDLNPETTVALANNPLATVNTTATVTVTVPSTAPLTNGQNVTIAGAATTQGITAAQLNITAPITIVDGTSFTYVSNGTATGTGAGGGNAVTITYLGISQGIAGTFVSATQALATATTGDVRGTYKPSTNADGTKRLTINYYSASGDTRNYNAASNGSLILNNNPITTVNTSATVTIYAPNHQYTGGENVTISGAATTNGITAANLNITAAVTIVDANNFTYIAGAAATGSGAGGGALVTMSPMFGNLYQNPTGRFGVSQYNIALI